MNGLHVGHLSGETLRFRLAERGGRLELRLELRCGGD